MSRSLAGKTVIVAGNAPSLAAVTDRDILTSDFIIRVNNFVFEQRSFTGQRVDLFVFGGDPRLTRFAAKTLQKYGQDYCIAAWTTHNPKVHAVAKRYLRTPFDHWVLAQTPLNKRVEKLCAEVSSCPLTGTYAVLEAAARGAERIILVGMSCYEGKDRYVFAPGPRHKRLLRRDFSMSGLDTVHHNLALEAQLLQLAAEYVPGGIFQIGDGSCASTFPAPPKREGSHVVQKTRSAPRDFVAFAGVLPSFAVGLYRFLRLHALRAVLSKGRRDLK